MVGPPPRERRSVHRLGQRPLHVGARGDRRDDDERGGPLLGEPPPERPRGLDVGDDPGEPARRADCSGQPLREGLERFGPAAVGEVGGQALVAEGERAGECDPVHDM